MADLIYGATITVADAKRVAAGAIAEAARNSWTMAVAIVDTGGHLVYFEKMDHTQIASVLVSQDKAYSAAIFKRPTKAFEDMAAAGFGGQRVFGLRGAAPVEGGLPLVKDGKIVGDIGLSGGTGQQDGQCAQAGAAAL